jgi:hypothetical protein
MRWKDGRLEAAEIRNPNAASGKLRCGERTARFALKPGEILRLNAALESVN